MTPVRQFYVDNLQGNLDATLAACDQAAALPSQRQASDFHEVESEAAIGLAPTWQHPRHQKRANCRNDSIVTTFANFGMSDLPRSVTFEPLGSKFLSDENGKDLRLRLDVGSE